MTDSQLKATAPEFRPRLQISIPRADQEPLNASHAATHRRGRARTFFFSPGGQQQSLHRRQLSFPITHSRTRLWANHPRMAELDRWLEVERHLKRMELIPRSPFVPHNFEEWVAFRHERLEDERLDQAKKLAKWQSSRMCPLGQIEPVVILPAMGGRRLFDGRSTVLCQQTIWSPWYFPTDERPQAPWPCPEEMKEEGDERNTSRFGRFPGLPRVPGNETVNWKQKNHLPLLPFDEVWSLPNADTFAAIWTPTEVDVMEDMEVLLGQELMDALNDVNNDDF